MINAATIKLRRYARPRQLVVGRIKSNNRPVPRHADLRAYLYSERKCDKIKITANVYWLSGNERGASAYAREKETDAGKIVA
jgi:hypothetical protein